MDLYVTLKLTISKSWFQVLFIDSSMIKNLNGIDCKGRNHFDRNRFGTKVSMLCDHNNIPITAVFYPANVNDAITIEDTLGSIVHNILPDKRYLHTLVGDKGYIIGHERKNKLLTMYRTNIVTPFRKNQNKINSKQHKQLLKKRIVVEHLFCSLDTFKHIRNRDDKHITHSS